MTQRYFRIPINVKPHVKKYIEKTYGPFITISLENPASIVLYGFLQKKSISILANSDHVHKKSGELTQVIYLHIQKRDRYRHGITINEKSHYLINLFFVQKITEAIFILANGYQKMGLDRTRAIEDFCQQHNIEIPEDITLDALKKNDYRYGQKLRELTLLTQMP